MTDIAQVLYLMHAVAQGRLGMPALTTAAWLSQHASQVQKVCTQRPQETQNQWEIVTMQCSNVCHHMTLTVIRGGRHNVIPLRLGRQTDVSDTLATSKQPCNSSYCHRIGSAE